MKESVIITGLVIIISITAIYFFTTKILRPLYIIVKKLTKWFKERKLRRAIKKADRLHKFNNKKYYVFQVRKQYFVVNNLDIKYNKKISKLTRHLNAYWKHKLCVYQTK